MVWSQALNKKDDQTQFLEKFFPRITKVTIDILDTLKPGEGKESDNNPLLQEGCIFNEIYYQLEYERMAYDAGFGSYNLILIVLN